MDQSMKTIDEIGEETESYTLVTPSTSKQDYLRGEQQRNQQLRSKPIKTFIPPPQLSKSDNQTTSFNAIPFSILPPVDRYWPGITMADGKHYASHRSCFRSLLTTSTISFWKQSPSAIPPPYQYLDCNHYKLGVLQKRYVTQKKGET